MKDPHSHVLFGVDDGAQTREESAAMLKAAKEAGVTAIVAAYPGGGRPLGSYKGAVCPGAAGGCGSGYRTELGG